MSSVIKVENVSKQYRLGSIGTNTLKGDLQRWWYNVRGLPDPTLIIGQENVLAAANHGPQAAHPDNFVWALKDINFEVKQGEVLGIIGKNGAGKSTLLKLLSRVTAPTTGAIRVKGRIASLLEVGTGFHPDLTGRENIFLNGAILGMTKREIQNKLEEIVEFAGIMKYIDTPVKRYSSGMYVRLAFAVAAHLEPEILIIDEVLAVGDAEFQNKAIGKMKDISSGEGRTVLLVSHNMETISRLCLKAILLENGHIVLNSKMKDVIDYYQKKTFSLPPHKRFDKGNYPGNQFARVIEISVLDTNGLIMNLVPIDEPFFIKVQYEDLKTSVLNTAIVQIKDEYGNILFSTSESNSKSWELKKVPGNTIAICEVPGNFLAEGSYTVLLAIGQYNPNIVHVVLDDVISFKIFETYTGKTVRKNAIISWPGLVRPLLNWEITSK